MSLEFDAFDIFHYNANACDDHLIITDGEGTTLLEKSCGSGSVLTGGTVNDYPLPPPIRSLSNTVKIVFKTNVGIARRGWRLQWRAVESGEF